MNEEILLRVNWYQRAGTPRILPFAVFMAFIGIGELAGFLERYGLVPKYEFLPFILYPINIVATSAVLLFFRHQYSEIRLAGLAKLPQSAVSIFLGLLVFVIWINLDYSFGTEVKGFDPNCIPNHTVVWLVTAFRLLGAVVIVPIMEELFWRSFIIRYLIQKNFGIVPIGFFTWPSFMIASILFGLEHHLIIAGVVAGVAYNILLYYTKDISQCILAHGTTNFALGIYVLLTGKWYFW